MARLGGDRPRVEGRCRAARQRTARASGRAVGRARAYLRASFDPEHAAPFLDPDELPGGAASLLAAIANDPELLGPVRQHVATWQAALEADGLAPGVATAIRLAADGLAFAELFGLTPPAGPARERALAALLALARPAPGAVG